MATINIENGKVSRIIEGYGFELTEIRMVKGEEYKTYYTIWNKEAKVSLGDIVTVEGDYSAKIDSYTDKTNVPRTKVSVSVNNAEVMLADAPF
jgi:ribosome maturation factor RimP